MLTLSGMIVANVGAEYINTYLNSKRYEKREEDEGKDIEYWVNDLIARGQLDIDDFENFLFDELSYGKRKSIRVYKIDNAYKLKDSENWINKLKDNYGLNSLEFKNIMTNIPSYKESERIAAISSEADFKGNVTKIRILLAAYAEIEEKGRIHATGAYYPIDIDLKKKCMIVKAWNRQGLRDGYKVEERLDHVASILSMSFEVKTKSFDGWHKKTLHNMSQGIIMKVYEKIPAFNQIGCLDEDIENFQQKVLTGLQLKNIERCENKICLKKNVFDFKDEVKKIFEKLCISDYFFDVPYEDIWNMGIDAIVSKIKFKDMEHVLTILSSEASEVPVFCTKTFLSLKKSLEDAKVVDRLWIEHNRVRGKLALSYDATKEQYLGMKILSNIRFTSEDLRIAEEIYNLYEQDSIRGIKENNQQHVM